MVNKFDTACSFCKEIIPAGQGIGRRVGKRTNHRHAHCVGKVAEAKVTVLDKGVYRVKREAGQRSFNDDKPTA